MFAAFLDRLLPPLVIQNLVLSKTKETSGRIFLVSFIYCGIVIVAAASVIEKLDGSAADAAAVGDCSIAYDNIDYGANPSDDATSNAVISSCDVTP